MLEGSNVEGLISLFNIEAKTDLVKYCRSLVVRRRDFVALIAGARAGALEPYKYDCHFDQKVGAHLHPSKEELAVLNQNGVGLLKGKAKKAVSKTFQLIDERRCLAAHLFYTPCYTYWYLFYFDQRDVAAENNRWKHGSHIHLVSSHWPNLTLENVWQQVLSAKLNFPNKIHLRYYVQEEIDA